MVFEQTQSIPSDHPSLAGHFSHNPVVPGVVMLGEVLKVVQGYENDTVTLLRISSVKFLSPLRPEEVFVITIEPERPGAIQFHCVTPDRRIAVGSLEYRVNHPTPREDR